jgi:hypothetical protein
MSSMMAASDSAVDRSTSVSSIRSTKVPPWPRASSQLKSAVRALPTWSLPVGLGANRTLMATQARRRSAIAWACDRLAATDGIHAFVCLSLDADPSTPISSALATTCRMTST